MSLITDANDFYIANNIKYSVKNFDEYLELFQSDIDPNPIESAIITNIVSSSLSPLPLFDIPYQRMRKWIHKQDHIHKCTVFGCTTKIRSKRRIAGIIYCVKHAQTYNPHAKMIIRITIGKYTKKLNSPAFIINNSIQCPQPMIL